MTRWLSLTGWIMAIIALVSVAEASETTRANYILNCSGCHGMTGMGTLEGGIPPFPDSVQKIANSENGRTYLLHVPGVVDNDMTDAEVADVLNYILDQWGDGEGHFTETEVSVRRAVEIGDVVVYRRQLVTELGATGIVIADYPWP
ncbi:MAG: c-type cytochrome [Paracoccus sp. (in: a-proteobacteria)]